MVVVMKLKKMEQCFFSGEGVERFLYNATKRSRQGKVFVYDRCNFGSPNNQFMRIENSTEQLTLRSPESNWFPLYQQITPDERTKETFGMLSGKCLDMDDY